MRGQFHETRWMEAKNNSGYEIPAFGLVKIVGAEWEAPNRTILLVERPDVDHAYPLAVNSFKPIANGDYGLVCAEGPVFAAYNDAATPTVGYAWGAAANSFLCTKDKNGCMILGGVDSSRDIVLVDVCRWEGYVEHITFQLAEALADTDADCTGTIHEQVGQGRPSPYTGAGEITLHNLHRDDGDYEYYGDSGHYGTASWMYGSHYRIESIQCPP